MPANLRTWALLLVSAAALAAAGCTTNPVSGDSEFSLVTRSDELALGIQDHPGIIYMYDGEYHDPELVSYLGSIVMRLQRCSHRPDMPMDFTIVNSSVVNAFAIPGHVYVTRGFLARLQNEAEFAAVMGHELTHVVAGHSAKRISQNMVIGAVSDLAGSVAGANTTAKAALSAGQLSVSLLGLSYSREQETQADRVGTYYMALAGYDPEQAVAMQKLLHSLSQQSGSILDRYLSDHPMADDRIAQIESVIREKHLEKQYIQGDGVYAERWKRHLAGLVAMDKAFALYDQGTKALAAKQYQDALAAARDAIKLQPGQAPFHRLEGDALLAQGHTAEAKAAYNEALKIDPRYVFAHLGLANVYNAEGDQRAVQAEKLEINRLLPGAV
jgi:predicted Zn-dependent protease